jgi:hypothetical protein
MGGNIADVGDVLVSTVAVWFVNARYFKFCHFEFPLFGIGFFLLARRHQSARVSLTNCIAAEAAFLGGSRPRGFDLLLNINSTSPVFLKHELALSMRFFA